MFARDELLEITRLLVLIETFLLHVDLKTRGSSLPGDQVAEKLGQYAETHARMEMPEGAQRYVAQRG